MDNDNLKQAILTILSIHKGRANAISRIDLVLGLMRRGFGKNEREARIAIQELRKSGALVGSCGGAGGGYFL